MDILNDILSALSVGLDAMFPDVSIYPEVVPEKVPPRCFLIGFAGGVETVRQLPGRHKLTGKLDITYLAPESKDSTETKRELNRVYAALALHLTHIRYGPVELLLKRHRRVDDGSDGTLHDLCDFDTFLFYTENIPVMETIDIEEERFK